MKSGITVLLLAVSIQAFAMMAFAADAEAPYFSCAPGTRQEQNSKEMCAEPEGTWSLTVPERSLLLPQESAHETIDKTTQELGTDKKIIIYFFRGRGCPHCEEETDFLNDLRGTEPFVEVRDYEVWYDKQHAALMAAMLRTYGVTSSGVPVTFVHDRVFSGFSKQTGAAIAETIRKCRTGACRDPGKGIVGTTQPIQTASPLPFTSSSSSHTGNVDKETSVSVPLLGELNANTYTLPVLTLVIAGMDSFNPCAFFVLLSLLGLLVHAQSRNKMFLIGGIFVFFSGFIYFIFMAAWLNLFLFMGHVAVITTAAGCVSVVIAVINIKDFFLFKRGVSLTIPDSAKPKLFDRMRKLLRTTSLVSIMIGATVLAVVANFYELLCTAGFPMVFTRILTLNNLSTPTYYLYLILYNIVYVIPLFIIVLGFTVTLGKRQLTEWQGRFLKLISGTMMFGLGLVLLINPALLNSVWISFIILVTALGISLLIAAATRWLDGD